MEDMSQIVKVIDRGLYGLRSQEIVATNQSKDVVLSINSLSTFPTKKDVFTVQDQQFCELYNKKLQRPLAAFLLSSIPDEYQWTMNAFRLGFKGISPSNQSNPIPIVIHLLIETPGFFTNNEAAAIKILHGMEQVIQQETHDKICIDVCQIRESMFRSSRGNPGVNLTDRFEGLYHHTPCPGFSIGNKKSIAAGSFTGFVYHENEIYGLTCRHVLLPESDDPDSVLSYKYDESEKLKVCMPALEDHQVTKQKIAAGAKLFRNKVKSLKAKLLKSPDSAMIRNEIQEYKSLKKKWASSLLAATLHDPNIGHAYAAPEKWRKIPTYDGFLDWGLFSVDSLAPADTDKELNQISINTSIGVEDFIQDDFSAAQLEEIKTKCEAITNSPFLNVKNPQYSSTPKLNTIFFKPASRTTDLEACKCNGILATRHIPGREPSREYAYVGINSKPASRAGDSGALICDVSNAANDNNDNETVFVPVAMVWGGDENHEGWPDVTYATPVSVVLKDIENFMGWDSGSVKFC
ncbi:hypothetical protein EAF04_002408 [Stromatinia cepivora]|nr:hypothetical protein EAF04_002408 [Stromatinia cepivora]